MADAFQISKLSPQPNGILKQQLVGAVSSSGGASDAGKVIVLDGTGQLDPSIVVANAGSITLTAGMNISAYRAVSIHPDGFAYHADAATTSDAGKVVGVAVTSAGTGTSVQVQPNGEVDNVGFLFTPGSRIYLGLSGALVATVPTFPAATFEQYMGVAASSSRLLLDIGLPVLLA